MEAWPDHPSALTEGNELLTFEYLVLSHVLNPRPGWQSANVVVRFL